jgi:hypothetical protein
VASSRPPGPDVHLVVANVQPPAARGLVRLPAWTASHPRGATPISLSGLGATPTQVRAELPRATGIEIHAHGLIDQRISDAALIALSPDPDGQYGLTAKEIVELNLARSPTVLLPACGAARMTPFVHESISLPAAFVAAGAREVLAATADIPDSAGLFFAAVRDRIDKGEDPAVALRDERLRELAKGPGARWVKSVLLYR